MDRAGEPVGRAPGRFSIRVAIRLGVFWTVLGRRGCLVEVRLRRYRSAPVGPCGLVLIPGLKLHRSLA